MSAHLSSLCAACFALSCYCFACSTFTAGSTQREKQAKQKKSESKQASKTTRTIVVVLIKILVGYIAAVLCLAVHIKKREVRRSGQVVRYCTLILLFYPIIFFLKPAIIRRFNFANDNFLPKPHYEYASKKGLDTINLLKVCYIYIAILALFFRTVALPYLLFFGS